MSRHFIMYRMWHITLEFLNYVAIKMQQVFPNSAFQIPLDRYWSNSKEKPGRFF